MCMYLNGIVGCSEWISGLGVTSSPVSSKIWGPYKSRLLSDLRLLLLVLWRLLLELKNDVEPRERLYFDVDIMVLVLLLPARLLMERDEEYSEYRFLNSTYLPDLELPKCVLFSILQLQLHPDQSLVAK